MATANLEVAVGLVKQAIDQDRKKNYEEAARCYRDAIIIFKSVCTSRGISSGVKHAINEKCAQYDGRLKQLDKYLLASADLTGIFKGAVEYHNTSSGTESNTSQESITSDSWKGLKNCPLVKQGIASIERGKKKDQRHQWHEALEFYEDGVNLVLEALHNNADQDQSIEPLRFKCLLVHERIEMIRSHVEKGLPVKPLNDKFEYSLNASGGSVSGSPEPEDDEEDQILRSEELGSTHSIYSQCKAIKNTSMTSLRSPRNDTPQSIPLADLDGELQLSSLSLASSKSCQSIKSYCSSVKASAHNNQSSHYEADFNITELTVENHALDLDAYKQSQISPGGSDSGISCRKAESASYASSNEDEQMLLVHRSGDGTPVIDPSPARSSPPCVKISPSASMKRQARLKAMADELTVLSQEDMVDTALMAKGAKAKVEINGRPEYIPPRAFARTFDDGEDEEINRGCYYFVSCLDALWIL